MSINYREKYLKYKTKYINLKKQSGGVNFRRCKDSESRDRNLNCVPKETEAEKVHVEQIGPAEKVHVEQIGPAEKVHIEQIGPAEKVHVEQIGPAEKAHNCIRGYVWYDKKCQDKENVKIICDSKNLTWGDSKIVNGIIINGNCVPSNGVRID